MHVMLSAPNPSDAARFIGHILSIISSTIRDRITVLLETTAPILPVREALAPGFIVVDVLDLINVCGVTIFFIGELIPLRLPAAITVVFACFS